MKKVIVNCQPDYRNIIPVFSSNQPDYPQTGLYLLHYHNIIEGTSHLHREFYGDY